MQVKRAAYPSSHTDRSVCTPPATRIGSGGKRVGRHGRHYSIRAALPAPSTQGPRRIPAQTLRAPLPPIDAAPRNSAPALSSLEEGTLGFGFSAGGLLFPYFLGVTFELQHKGILKHDTPVAGASAGSLIAACCKSGLSHDTLISSMLGLAAECRTRGTRHNLGPILRSTLYRVLPDDIHERANSGRVHVAVTRLTPQLQPLLVCRFTNREDLIEALLTSCHIPWYFDGSLYRKYRDYSHFDGGLSNFIPTPTSTTYCARVSCFPSKQLGSVFGELAISPDTYEQWPYDMRTMLGWAFEPASEELLLDLIAKGRRDARAWAVKEGLISKQPTGITQTAAGITLPGSSGGSTTGTPLVAP